MLGVDFGTDIEHLIHVQFSKVHKYRKASGLRPTDMRPHLTLMCSTRFLTAFV